MVRRIRADLIVSKGDIDVTDLEIEIRPEVKNTEKDVTGWDETEESKAKKIVGINGFWRGWDHT